MRSDTLKSAEQIHIGATYLFIEIYTYVHKVYSYKLYTLYTPENKLFSYTILSFSVEIIYSYKSIKCIIYARRANKILCCT